MTKRRDFLKSSGLTSLGFAAGLGNISFTGSERFAAMPSSFHPPTDKTSIIGQYGEWAASWLGADLPSLSFRRDEFANLDSWRAQAKGRLIDRLAIPDIGPTPAVNVIRSYEFDGISVEEIKWQLPYGRPTEAVVLKPARATGKLPAVLAFHDHGGNKYFGIRKIIRTSDKMHPLLIEHQQLYYEGKAWANELAKRGYVVLVSDAYTFGSRRVMMADVPPALRRNLRDENPEEAANIRKYNDWAGDHEHIMAKSLFCAGTTWPAVFFAEDKVALDILCRRADVDAERVGCCGLSGGGLRTVLMGGLETRIKCAVSVGFMSTWKDFLLNKSYTHTWMLYIPLLPKELDFPEIFGLRAPMATLVLNNEGDELFSLDGMRDADEILTAVYKKSRAAANYKCSFYPGPHKFDKAMQDEAFTWLDRSLKN